VKASNAPTAGTRPPSWLLRATLGCHKDRVSFQRMVCLLSLTDIPDKHLVRCAETSQLHLCMGTGTESAFFKHHHAVHEICSCAVGSHSITALSMDVHTPLHPGAVAENERLAIAAPPLLKISW